MRTIVCWKLESISDHGPFGFVGRFATREAAEDAKTAAGGYGPKISKEIIRIYDSATEFNPERFDSEARESGLSKLSERERAALGLDS